MNKSIVLKRISATAQFILGFMLGIGVIAGVTGAAVWVYYQKMSTLPTKPVYPKLQQNALSEQEIAALEEEIEPLESNTTEDEVTETPEVIAEPSPEPSESSAAVPELPPNAYRAVVTWPQGLTLRAEPTINAGRVGGIDANATIIILEDSADGKWQRVRLPWSNQEGWVKGGNTKRTSY
ncbi:MAG: SH3 domain-containing protein [Cyanobacteria bacterium J06621_8]